MAHPSLRIAILGGGVAGPSCAAFLALGGHRVTVFERSRSPRKTGQAIDIRGPGVGTMRKLGLEDAVRAHNTTEKGVVKVDANNNTVFAINATGDTSHQTITSEYEILRSDLVNLIVAKAEEKGVQTIYGEYVTELKQDNAGVQVEYANGRQSERFDAVVGADGVSSRTRSLLTGRPARDDFYQPCEEYCAYFTIPRASSDPPGLARGYTGGKGRLMFLRPTRKENEVGAILMMVAPQTRKLGESLEQGVEAQKAVVAEWYADAGWESERILKAMHAADDFYFQTIDQVRTDKFAYDRVALLGDACHAVMGMGTSAAMYGGYVLAGEISKTPNDVPAALQRYEAIMRPFADKIQKQAGAWGARIMSPQSQLGVRTLDFVGWAMCKARLMDLGAWIGSKMGGEDVSVPEYDFGVAEGKL